MKKILKLSSIAFLLFAGVACENDDQKIIQGKDAAELLAPVNGATYVLLPENAASEMTTFVWNHAEYTQQTSSNYEVQAAVAGTDFASPISLGTTQGIKFLTLTVEEMNGKMLTAGFTPYSEAELDVRVKSSLGDNQEIVSYSNVITLKITPYSTELPKLWVPGSYQNDSGYGSNWTHSTAPKLASSGYGQTDYEGYVYFANSIIADNDNGFKFTSQPNWDGTNYGDDGSFSGVISATGGNIGVNVPGYYRVQVNTGSAMSYNLTPTTWAIIGNATSGGWSTDTPMTYNPTTKKWEVIATLTAQSAPNDGLKFRANGSWDLNLGDTAADGTMEYGGENIGTSAGTFKIELDLSNPRAYSYSITAQ